MVDPCALYSQKTCEATKKCSVGPNNDCSEAAAAISSLLIPQGSSSDSSSQQGGGGGGGSSSGSSGPSLIGETKKSEATAAAQRALTIPGGCFVRWESWVGHAWEAWAWEAWA